MTTGGPGHPGQAPTPRQVQARRFFLVHVLAYVLALPWGAAVVPAIFKWWQPELLALPSETDAVRYVVKLALWPMIAAFVVPHLFGIPWIRAATEGTGHGWRFFVATAALYMATGLVIAIYAWTVLLQR